jgi:Spy/CpxP family protein refolding chaperone
MEVGNRDKWQVGTGVLLIFALGFVAGALALNLYRTYHPTAARGRQHHLEQTLDSLNLSEDQKTQVKQIFSDTRKQLMQIHDQSRPQVSEIRKQARERLKAVMTPDQFNQFQQTMKEGWEGHGGQHGPHHGDHGEQPGAEGSPGGDNKP